jgi:cytochrome c5
VEKQMKTPAINRRFCKASVVALAILTALPALSTLNAQQPQGSKASTTQSARQDTSRPAASDGEKKFKQNCSRCHEAPQALSPSISGTVLRHMRVRASLSQQDERDILKFLNP